MSVPTGSTNSQGGGTTQTYTPGGTATATAANTYVDDVLLQTVTFSGTTINTSGINDSLLFRVITGREDVSPDFGQAGTEAGYRPPGGTSAITDTGADGNPNPFVSARITTKGQRVTQAQQDNLVANQNTTSNNQQDSALQAAFNSRSISQGADGEGTVAYSYRLIFDQGLIDNNNAADGVPELIFFERGVNSAFSVRAITGGTFDNPTFAPTTVNVASTTASGIFIDTVEIDAAQQLGIAGIDLNEFGITATTAAANQVVYGFELTSGTGGTGGADIYGNFTSAASTTQLRAVPSGLAVPEPLTILGSGIALGFGALMKREHSRKRQKTEQTG